MAEQPKRRQSKVLPTYQAFQNTPFAGSGLGMLASSPEFYQVQARGMLSLLRPEVMDRVKKVEQAYGIQPQEFYYKLVRPGHIPSRREEVVAGLVGNLFPVPGASQAAAGLLSPESQPSSLIGPALEIPTAVLGGRIAGKVLGGTGKLLKKIARSPKTGEAIEKLIFGKRGFRVPEKEVVEEKGFQLGKGALRKVNPARARARLKMEEIQRQVTTPRLPATTPRPISMGRDVDIGELYPQLLRSQTPVPTLKETMQRIPEKGSSEYYRDVLSRFERRFGKERRLKSKVGPGGVERRSTERRVASSYLEAPAKESVQGPVELRYFDPVTKKIRVAVIYPQSRLPGL